MMMNYGNSDDDANVNDAMIEIGDFDDNLDVSLDDDDEDNLKNYGY